MVDLQSTMRESDVQTLIAIAGEPAISALKSRVVSISAVALKAAAVAIDVIPAVADKMLIFEGAALKLIYGSEVLAEPSAPDDPVFGYVDESGVACSAAFDAGQIIVAAADAYAWIPAIQVEGGTLAEHVNVPIVFYNSGTDWTGNASNDTILQITVFYREVSF